MPTATATIMFTDLVGSTALMSRVGEVAADALRREHFDLLRGPIGARGGVEVKNLGDGLMVSFTSAADAVAAAVEVQQALWHRNQRAGEVLEIRLGLAVGDVEIDDGDHFGAPVVQAARLCALAGTGEVLCTELVRMMAGTRTSAEFEPVGALELKGLDEPVPTARVRWSVPEPSSTNVERSLPGRLAMAVAPDFVGRSAEVDVLTSAWKEVGAGERRVVLLAGEPGIGKTTLSARLASSVHEAGGLVTYGRSDEDLGIPYQPWIESLSHLVAQLPAEVVDAHVADRGSPLACLVPELGRVVGGSSGAAVAAEGAGEQYVLFGCVVDLLERASAYRPVLVVLDDLHWADRQSLQLLRHVVSCGRPLRVLVVGTFRDSEVRTGDPLSELLAALHREQGTERIAVRGLTDADVLDLLEQLAGHDLDEAGIALRDAVLTETSGNPFFVREILRHLVESGAIYRDGSGRWVGDADVGELGLPVSVPEVIGRRLAALGDESVRLLSLAAVIGRDFDVRLLATAAGADEDDVVDRCDLAVQAAVLTTTDQLDRYSFAHALIERTLYEGLSRARRARAHRVVAEALEQLVGADATPRAAELAHHWSEAVQPDDASRALRYAQLAGDRALAQLAPDDAARWYARALELLGEGDDAHLRAELLVGLGTAQAQIGFPTYRSSLAEAAALAEASGDAQLLATAALASCRGWGSNVGLVDEELITLLSRALELIDPADVDRRARLLVELAAERIYGEDLDAAWSLAAEAIDLARTSDDPALLAKVLQRGAVVNRDPLQWSARRAQSDEAIALARRLDDPFLEWEVFDQARLVALEAGDLTTMRQTGSRAAAAAARAPRADVLWVDAFHRVWGEIIEGDLARAEASAHRALEMGLESGQPDATTIFGAQLANIRYHEGRMDELRSLIEDAVRDYPTLGYAPVLTLLHAREGRTDLARAGLDEAAATGFTVRRDQTFTMGYSCWAFAAARTGHPSAASLVPRLVPVRDGLVTAHVTVMPSAAYYLGLLEHAIGDLAAAERSFALADEIHRRVESPLFVLYSDVGRAALLADRAGPGEREEAQALAEGVLSASEANGYGYLAVDARAVLDRLQDAT